MTVLPLQRMHFTGMVPLRELWWTTQQLGSASIHLFWEPSGHLEALQHSLQQALPTLKRAGENLGSKLLPDCREKHVAGPVLGQGFVTMEMSTNAVVPNPSTTVTSNVVQQQLQELPPQGKLASAFPTLTALIRQLKLAAG